MVDIKYHYTNHKYKINTYDNIVATHLWIDNAFKYVLHEKGELEISTYIDFEFENTTYQCYSLDDFKKHAFNKQIVCTNFYMSVCTRKNSYITLISVCASNLNTRETEQSFTISSKDELLISNLRDALSNELKYEPQIPQTTSTIPVTQISYEDNSIHIHESNISNSSIGQTNTTNISSENKGNEKWYEKLFWKVFIPILVTLIGATLCLWLGLNG